MANSLQKRDPSIDLLRFIGLTMIILAHIGLSRSISLLFQLRSFDVPLMVFTSGLAFSGRNTGAYLPFIGKRTLRLIVPVYLFVAAYILLNPILSGWGLVDEYTSKVIAGTFMLRLNPSIGYVWIIRAVSYTHLYDKLEKFVEDNAENPFMLMWTTTVPHSTVQAPEDETMYYVDKLGEEKTPITDGGWYYPVLYPKSSYAAMITHLDAQVGKLVRKLKDLGIYENTMFVITSDNGPASNSNSPMDYFKSGGPFKCTKGWGKSTLQEGGIRTVSYTHLLQARLLHSQAQPELPAMTPQSRLLHIILQLTRAEQ